MIAKQMETNKKKLTVMAVLGVIVCVLLFLWFSIAKYTSRVEGHTQYEPSLFNTVLLGDLKFFTDANGNVMEQNGRLGASIVVDASMEFGALDGKDSSLTSSERRLRPGSVIAIPFTVTNGTSIGELTGYESNLAGTDIVYKLNLITTVNIPLEYDVYEYTTAEQLAYMKEKSVNNDYNYDDYTEEMKLIDFSEPNDNWGKKLNVIKGDITASETIGYSRSYEVRPSTYVENAGDGADKTNKFLLQRADDGNQITVKRYMLVVYWPDEAETDEETMKLLSSKYMKEIDILEVRLEVESWVENNKVSSPIYNEMGEPILRLSSMPLGDERYYSLPAGMNAYSRTTIPFYATRKLNTNTSYLDFTVTNNASATSYVYDEETETYRASTLTSLSGGKVAIALPIKNTMGNVNDYSDTQKFAYSLVYNNVSYTGRLTDKKITTEVNNETVNAYQIVEFYDNDGNMLTLCDFDNNESVQIELRLLINEKETVSYDNKDDFKILVYKENLPAGDDGNE